MMKLISMWDSRGWQNEGVFLVWQPRPDQDILYVKAGWFISHSELLRDNPDKEYHFVAAGRFDKNGNVTEWHSGRYRVSTPGHLKPALAEFIKKEAAS